MVTAFQRVIRTARNKDHGGQTNNVRNHHQGSDRGIRVFTETSLQRLTRSDSPRRQPLLFFTRQFSCDPVFFRCCQKSGFRRSSGQQEACEDTAQNRWNPLQNQQPSPTADSKPMDVIQNQTRNRGTEDAS